MSLLLLINALGHSFQFDHLLDAADLRPRHVGAGNQLSTHPTINDLIPTVTKVDFDDTQSRWLKAYFERELEQGAQTDSTLSSNRRECTTINTTTLIGQMNDSQNPTYHLPKAITRFRDNIIPIQIEHIGEGETKKYMVKIGPPCDLSGLSEPHQKNCIRAMVTQALKDQNIDVPYQDVYVSANVAVKGQMQTLRSMSRTEASNAQSWSDEGGSHKNAFIKCPGETTLTKWEPRDNPQATFDDGICAMTTALVQSQFEYGARQGFGWAQSSEKATHATLMHPKMSDLFRDLQVASATSKFKPLGLIVKLMLNFSAWWNKRQWEKKKDKWDSNNATPPTQMKNSVQLTESFKDSVTRMKEKLFKEPSDEVETTSPITKPREL